MNRRSAPRRDSGARPSLPDPDRYAQRYAHCDVLVVGAGPAGLAAALAAAESGARVMLCDEQAEFGGSLLANRAATIDGLPAAAVARARRIAALRRQSARDAAAAHDGIRLLPAQPDRPLTSGSPITWRIRMRTLAARAALAGARARGRARDRRDRAAAGFPGQRPARASCWPAPCGPTCIVTACAPAPRAVVVTANDAAYAAALDLQAAGVDDCRDCGRARCSWPVACCERLRVRAGIEILTRAIVRRHARRAPRQRRRHRQRPTSGIGADRRTLRCDCVLMSGGFTPSVHLFSQSRGKLQWDEATRSVRAGHLGRTRTRGRRLPRRRWPRDGAGRWRRRKALPPQRPSGHDEPRRLRSPSAGSMPAPMPRPPAPSAPAGDGVRRPSSIGSTTSRANDLALAAREGFRSIEHVKRYTTTGMATDQGKTSNLNALGDRRRGPRQADSRSRAARRSACRTRR